MSNDPDFVLMVAGQDVTKYCQEWELIDDEERMSGLSATIGNPDMKFSGLADVDADISIRFGYAKEMGGMAAFAIKEVSEEYGTKASTVKVRGYDEQEKLCGGKGKGNFDKDMSVREILEAVGEGHGLQIEGEGDSPKLKDTPFGVFNEKPRDLAYRLQRMAKAKGKKGGKAPKAALRSGSGAKPPRFHGHAWDKGHTESGAGPQPFPEGKEIDENRAGNNKKGAGSVQVSAQMELRGYPTLKAKAMVSIAGVGPMASGTYYVKQAKHRWALGQGYRSSAELIRGGTGKGDAGGDQPMVMYADIWNKGQVYVGERKIEGTPQATFTYGDGKHLIRFELQIKVQEERGGGEGKGGQVDGIDFRDLAKPYLAEPDGKSDSK